MTIPESLAAYGYSMQDTQIISPKVKPTGVYVTQKKGRVYCRNVDNRLLWSGNTVSDFLESFWFAPLCKHE